MNKPLRWGVLGATSYIAGHVAPAVIAAAGARLEAVASRPSSAAAAAQAAGRWHAELHLGYCSLLANPAIDAVYIALPNAMHREWILRSLEAGKHVLAEKPLVTTVEDWRLVDQAAAKSGLLLMEAFMYWFHPQMQRALRLLRSGTIGDLVVVRASFAYPIAPGSGNIRLDPSLGGGATWDVGCYAVDAACCVFGRTPQDVSAKVVMRQDVALDGTVVATLGFGSGRYALIDYSIDYGPQACIQLQGTRGSITVHDAWAFADQPGKLTVRSMEGTHEELIDAANHYELEVSAFCATVAGHQPPGRMLGLSGQVIETCARILGSATKTT